MTNIRSEGGLLPADVLARIASLEANLGGLRSEDYHLPPNERIGEAIARSWARLTSAWEAFSNDRDGLTAGDHAGKTTRERLLLPLFSELGYGRLIQQPGAEVDGKAFAVFCEYNHSPLHLVGAGVPLDRRTAGVRGAAEQSPHSLVQELLNRSTERLWGIVTNGLSLRLLRDNVTLTRQAYVEFDLEAIFATEAYEDFALLWLCAHQSRVEASDSKTCWLERWTQTAQRDGTRALGELRSGVERAIEALGRGFLAQPANAHLHAALRDGDLDGDGYYRELLRLVYRLLFVFVAEDRDALLLSEDGSAERRDARARYNRFYGTRRLRRLSVRRRGGRAHDLYEQVKLVTGWLHDGGQPRLAVPPLGSALWSPETTAHVTFARLGNEALLEAIRELAFIEGGRRPVDFRNLGAEELGSVYESLLELHPEMDRESASFALTTATGHERKQTGSYYTPTSLIGSLLESAMDPVIDAAAAGPDAEQALLQLTVCDPACGSGHFLIAAANRIAKRLAAVRERDPEPAPEAIRRAIRDVVSRCIYGVDANPMAVELCKVSLWMEALEPGRPLSFLDNKIIEGNSLVGATPTLMAAGVADEAFKPLIGDDPQFVRAAKARNRREREGQMLMRLETEHSVTDAVALSQATAKQNALPDDSPEQVRRRASAFAAIQVSPEYARLKLSADAWVAAFVAFKSSTHQPITTGVVRRAQSDGRDGLTVDELSVIDGVAATYVPLHWHVAFPDVFADPETRLSASTRRKPGFDCLLGNPPWELVELREREWFASSHPEIATARTAAVRKKLITDLTITDPAAWDAYVSERRSVDAVTHFCRSSEQYRLTAQGRLNTYAMFAELMRRLRSADGSAGLVAKSGLVGDLTYSPFLADLLDRHELSTVFDFDNREGIFPAVGGNVRFALITIRASTAAVEIAAKLTDPAQIRVPGRAYTLTSAEIRAMSPITPTLPLLSPRVANGSCYAAA